MDYGLWALKVCYGLRIRITLLDEESDDMATMDNERCLDTIASSHDSGTPPGAESGDLTGGMI